MSCRFKIRSIRLETGPSTKLASRILINASHFARYKIDAARHLIGPKITLFLRVSMSLAKKKKFQLIGITLVLAAIASVSFFAVSFFPPKVRQSPSDLIANQGLSSMLTELGADGFGSVCWLGDLQEKFADQYIGSHEALWPRLKEKLRVRVWKREGNCFGKQIKAVVVLFPYTEMANPAETKSAALIGFAQRDMSLFLSQTGPGSEFEKQSSTFHLQTGANFQVFTRRPAPNSQR